MNLTLYDIYIIFYIFYMYISHIYYLQIFFHSLLHTDKRMYFFTLMTTLIIMFDTMFLLKDVTDVNNTVYIVTNAA